MPPHCLLTAAPHCLQGLWACRLFSVQEPLSVRGGLHLPSITPPSPPAGPSGCCKSTTVRVLASVLGFEVVEWAPPTPTTWSEHRYQVRGAGRGGEGGDADCLPSSSPPPPLPPTHA